MSEHLWTTTTHTIPASHPRGYPRGVRNPQTDHPHLSITQYTPKPRPKPNSNPITLLIAHGIGSAKELYEPLLDDLLRHQNLPIRSAWSIDVAHHGKSYLLNETIIGDEPHWLDPARDMLHAVNYFQDEMPQPIYGIGQSWGCVNILMMSSFHTRLFAGMIFMEPVFETGYRLQTHGQPTPRKDSETRIALLAKRRDMWPSRAEAETHFRKNPYFATFDPRVFSRVLKHNLRNKPLPGNPYAVTLTTPKAQEVATFGRPDPPLPGYEAGPDYKNRAGETKLVEGFYRGEVTQIKRALPDILPPVLYLWGTESDVGNSSYPQRIIDQTGIGENGGGGVATRQVESQYIEGADHLIPYKMPGKAAESIAKWLRMAIDKWIDDANSKPSQPPFNPGTIHPLWLERFSKL